MRPGIEEELVFNLLRQSSEERSFSNDDAHAVAAQFGIEELRQAVVQRLQAFGRSGVANPSLLKSFGIRPWFFLASGRTGQFEQVINAASSAASGISHYVLYGDWDALIILNGSDEEATQFSSHLTMGAYEVPESFSAECVLMAQRLLPVPLTENADLSDTDQDMLNTLIEDFDASGVAEEDRQRLLECGALIGSAWRDQSRSYAPVTAFVGIHLRGRSALSPSAVLASLAADERIGPALRDLYQIQASLPYHYVARLACASLTELDQVTDALGLLRIGSVDLKCTTHVVASCSESPPMFRQPEIPGFNAGVSTVELIRETEQVFKDLSAENQDLFNSLSGTKQLLFLSQFLRLMQAAADETLDDATLSRFRTATNIFAGEVLRNPDEPNLTSAVTEIASRVEQLGRDLLALICRSAFGRDSGLAQKELRLPSKSVSGLSLGKVASALKTASTNPHCERFHPMLDDEFLDKLEVFSQDRNLWVHGATDSRPDEAVRTILLGHEIAVWILRQIQSIEDGAEKVPESISTVDFFISHASEDKADVARPIYELLKARGYSVWLDESELTVGDSLREKIDAAISSCHFGIVVLSPDFFSKNWPQQELNALFARQMTGRKIILPVWHAVDRSTVMRYSPLLADRLAANTNGGIEAVAEQVVVAYEASRPKA